MKRLILAVRMRLAAQKHMHRPYSFRVCWVKAGDLLSPSIYDAPKAPWKSVGAYVAGCAVALLIVWAMATKADAKEQGQLTEKALVSCLNRTGMVINNEIWVCENTRLKP